MGYEQGYFPPRRGIASPNTSNRLRAVNDYLRRTSDGSNGPDGPNTLQVAQNIDAAIAKSFVSEKYTALLILMLIATSS
jgi:hypothetical protein